MAGIVFGLILGLSFPAVADHVQEPTNPITGLDTSFFDYPDKSTVIDCVTFAEAEAGAELDTFEQKHGRLHFQVRFDGGPPTEHWTTKISVFTVLRLGPGRFRNVGLWDARWTHQNVGPHVPDGAREGHADLWNMARHIGMWRVVVEVTGDESGNSFTSDCVFEKTGN